MHSVGDSADFLGDPGACVNRVHWIAILAATILGIVAAFQILLAAGLPYGKAGVGWRAPRPAARYPVGRYLLRERSAVGAGALASREWGLINIARGG